MNSRPFIFPHSNSHSDGWSKAGRVGDEMALKPQHSLGRLKQEDNKVQASLSYIVRHHCKK